MGIGTFPTATKQSPNRMERPNCHSKSQIVPSGGNNYYSIYKGTAYTSFDPETLVIRKDLPKPAVPTVILINENCYSACEDLLVSIYEQENRPLLIGTETGGSTGAPLVIELPGGGIARICTLRIKYPKSNTPFVGKGVIPDKTINVTLEDELLDFDRILEEGINELKKEIAN